VQNKITELLTQVEAGDYKALAKAITLVENDMAGAEELLLALRTTEETKVIGVTGPPGAGKSSLVNALLAEWVAEGRKVAVIAVDPSSPFNYGALLGDRIRMSEFYNNNNVFIRSLASRGALGGLSTKIIEITDVIKAAPFDYIVVETVGVGQSEVEIAGLADCTIVTLVPEAGDEVQTLKAGIMEIADIFVINKADREGSEALFKSLRIMAHERFSGREVPVLKTVATAKTGIEDVGKAINAVLAEKREDREKRLQLLAEKSWQLIQAQKMKPLSKTVLMGELKKALNEPGFNIYSFIRAFVAGSAVTADD
jgi:LAO/AO transport system kinase